MHRRHLPIAEPCHENWETMDKVARGRHCQVCEKQVYDLSAMTERRAKSLLAENAGQNICVRYRYRPDGAVKFARPAVAAGGAALLAVALAACTPHEHPDVAVVGEVVQVDQDATPTVAPVIPEVEPPEVEMLGEIAVEPPPPPIPEAQPLMGKIAAPDPEPLMGSVAVVPAQQPPENVAEPIEYVLQGDIEAPSPEELPCDAAPEQALKGRIAVPAAQR